MKFRVLGAVLATVFAFAAPAMAVTTVSDILNPAEELDLYEIYNALYGTAFTSSGAGQLETLQVNPDEVFNLINPTADVQFVARFAGNEQRFGYYTASPPSGDPTVSGGGVDGDFHHLFDAATTTGLILDGTGVVATIGDSPFALYLNTPLNSGFTWFSQAALNSDAADHMVMYSIAGDPGKFMIAWEDLPDHDWDYNDLVIEISFIPIPEPSTIALMLIGLGGAAIRRRFAA